MAKTVEEKSIGNGLSVSKRESTPPARYTEATLVKKLQALGIGRPSTYATIVDTVLSTTRGYAEKDGKYIKPTTLGMSLSKFLDESFSDIIKLDYTREMEESLDKIASGKETRPEFLSKFYTAMEDEIKKNPNIKAVQKTDKLCPQCGKPLVVRHGRYGNFIGCSGYPNCRYIEKNKK